ncbi:MAG: nucleotidyltransferase domain-containing protein [Candidatus Rokubacteria bacterium]|nr:nucleotidyltransferase domain-containing protein [Candidatus Rokubacteria bacterium]
MNGARDLYGDDLRSLVLYGSVARGSFGPGSDVDLLIVLDRSPLSWGKRMSQFIRGIVERPEVERAAAGLRRSHVPSRVEPIVLTEAELAPHPPLLLDLTEDSVVLVDSGGVFAREIARVRDRLAELGARRVWHSPDRWYWLLTPEIEPGQVITI